MTLSINQGERTDQTNLQTCAVNRMYYVTIVSCIESLVTYCPHRRSSRPSVLSTMAGSKSILILSYFSLGILLFLLLKTTPAEASLYPTKPIANTTYIAGQAALVTWVENGINPLLAACGKMKIDLYAGHNVSLTNRTALDDLIWGFVFGVFWAGLGR
jgi:hypothetical protein